MFRGLFSRCFESDSEGYEDDDSDEEISFFSKLWRSSSGRELPSPSRRVADQVKACTPRRRPVLSRGAPKACAAALVLMGITSFAAISFAQKSQSSQSAKDQRPVGMTAREVVASEQLLSTASRAMLKTLKQEETWGASLRAIPEAQIELVEQMVKDAFANISIALQKAQMAEELDSFSLTEGQLEAMLNTIEHMADPRVQEIGSSVAKALKLYFEIEGPNAGKEGMKLHLLQALQPEINEIRSLWRQVKMGSLHGPGLGWGVSVDPSRLFLVRSYNPFERYDSFKSISLCQTLQLCVMEGSHEEARMVLLQMEALLTTFGMHLEVEKALASPKPTTSFLAMLMACQRVKSDDLEAFQRMSCAMRYASTGLDVMSSIRGSAFS